MTKLRPPLSCELALTRIAGVIGWDKVAGIAGQKERTVRDWSEPDTLPTAGQSLTMDVALDLDVAYRLAGGQGAPMLHYFATRQELDCFAAAPASAAIALAAALACKEGGEGIAAAIAAAQPDADHADLVFAERQLEESSAATTAALLVVRARRAALAAIRAPEVAPPAAVAAPAG